MTARRRRTAWRWCRASSSLSTSRLRPGRADRARRPLRQVQRRDRSRRPAPQRAGADLGQRLGHGQDSSGERPPALRGISIAINRGGRLDAHGLPVCHRGQIEPSSTSEAHARLRPRAGRRRLATTADVAFPEQSSFPSHGRILAFNSIVDGGARSSPTSTATKPAPITRIIVFHDQQGAGGTFGTILTRLAAGGAEPERISEEHQPRPASAIHLPRQASQLPQRQLRRPGGLSRRRFSPSPGRR